MNSSAALDKISKIITELAVSYPEILRTLGEENFFFGRSNDNSINEKELNSYFTALKNVLDCYKKNHQDKIILYPK